MNIPKLELVHVDTCLPDYWSGHHRPHISIPIPSGGILVKDLRESLLSELNQGAIAGTQYDWETLESEEFYNRAKAAINRARPAQKHSKKVFKDIVYDDSETEESVYAYFVFVELL